ncbi:hypothetical protein [Parasphingorhabdus sp. NYA22]
MAFVFDREIHGVRDDERGVQVREGGGRGDLGEMRYHILLEDCEFVRTTWKTERGILFHFSEKKSNGLRDKRVTIEGEPIIVLQTSKNLRTRGDCKWDEQTEALYREGIYSLFCIVYGTDNMKIIPLYFTWALDQQLPERYVPPPTLAVLESK